MVCSTTLRKFFLEVKSAKTNYSYNTVNELPHQGCQMKISIHSQTMLTKGQKKAKLHLRYCRSFVTKKHLNYKNVKKMSSKLR